MRDADLVERLVALWLPRSLGRVLVVTVGAAGLAAGATTLAWPRLAATTQPYPDLVAGLITFSDYPKVAEYRAAACFALVFVLAWPLLTLLVNRLRSAWWRPPAAVVCRPLVPDGLMAGLAAYAVSFGVLTRSWPWLPFAAAIALVAAWRALARRADALRALLIGLVCGYFSLLGLLAALAAMSPSWFVGRESRWSVAALAILATGCVGLVIGHQHRSPERWHAIVGGSQVLLPLLLTVLAHDAYVHDGRVVQLNIPPLTRIAVFGGTAVACGRALMAWRRATPWTAIPEADRVIGTSSVVSIGAFFAYRVPDFSGFEWDLHHLGELLLPWHQATRHHRTLYDEFVPVQGGMGLLYGAINALALDGTVASFPIAVSWVSVAAAAVATWTLCRLVGPAWALLLAPFLPIGYVTVLANFNRLFLALPILAVLAHPALWARPTRWLAAWAGVSLLHVVYHAIAGLACTAATTPVAAWAAWRARAYWHGKAVRSSWSSRRSAALAIVVGAVALAPTTRKYLWGIARFVRENAPTNTVAFGVGGVQSGAVPDWFWWPGRKLAWEAIRIGGWVGGVLVLWALLVHQVSRRARGGRVDPTAVVFTLTGGLLLLALAPYSLGQVWPDEPSRSGAASLLAIGSLVPTALVLTFSRVPRAALALAVCVGALFGARGAFGDPDPWRLAQRAVAAIDAPARTAPRSGSSVGLPLIGEGFVLPDKFDAVRRLHAALRRLLRDGETYLDLTNRPALYFVFDRPVPVPYPNDYNTPNAAIQRRILASLQRDPPPVAWIGPREGIPTSLRAYRVYRWLIERAYRFVELEGYQFLVRPDRAASLDLTGALNEEAALRRALAPTDLGRLPLAWGRALGRPAVQLQPAAVSLAVQADGGMIGGADSMLVWRVDPPIRGTDADFAVLRLRCDRTAAEAPAMQVWWTSEPDQWSAERSLLFRLASGELLLPLGSHPGWLRSATITHLAFRVEQGARSRCSGLRLGQPRLLRLAD